LNLAGYRQLVLTKLCQQNRLLLADIGEYEMVMLKIEKNFTQDITLFIAFFLVRKFHYL
jgi:hypothetical protein